uniref:Uncharacterized protein n=1 Tax=Parascaris equorum TaxID=6256 RepID=A0A914RBA5_PAREQ
MLTAGASFSAGLTDKGSVVAWGNIRVSCFSDLKDSVIIFHYNKNRTDPFQCGRFHSLRFIFEIAAGENHLVMLSENGELLTFGDGSMGQLGRLGRVSHIRAQQMVDDSGNYLRVSVLQKGKGKLVGPELRIMRPTESPAYAGRKFVQLCGVQHMIALDENGKNTDNALGLGTWTGNDDTDHWRYTHLEKIELPTKAAGIAAKLGCSLAWNKEGWSQYFFASVSPWEISSSPFAH